MQLRCKIFKVKKDDGPFFLLSSSIIYRVGLLPYENTIDLINTLFKDKWINLNKDQDCTYCIVIDEDNKYLNGIITNEYIEPTILNAKEFIHKITEDQNKKSN